jgi:hypothetical protein
MKSKRAKDLKQAVKHFNAIESLHKKYPEIVPLVITDMSMIELAREATRASGRKAIDFSD